MQPYSSYKNKAISTFVVVGICLVISEAIYDLVFANIAYSITGNVMSVTTTYAIGYCAEILVTLIGAGFIDNFNKWTMFIVIQIFNIIVFFIALVILSGDNPTVSLVWFFAFFVDLIHQYSRLIIFSLVPFLFTNEEIPNVNSTVAVFNGMAKAVGPAIGTVAIIYVGLTMSLLSSVAFMLGALIFTIMLGMASPTCFIADEIKLSDENSFKKRVQKSIVSTSVAAFDLLTLPRWRWFMASYSSCVLVIGILVLLWIPLLRNFHGFSEATTGFLVSIGTLGTVIGGFILRGYSQLSKITSMLRVAHFIMAFGICFAIFARSNAYFVALGMFSFQAGVSLYFRCAACEIQTSIPKEIIGSWYGAIDFISRFVGLFGILLAGWVFEFVGPYTLYSLLLALIVITAIKWRR